MKLSELQAEVNKDIDDSLNNSDITGWLNRAIDDLTPYAKYKKTADIVLVPDEKQYYIPDDLIEIIHLVDEDEGEIYQPILMDDFASKGFKRWGNVLRFQPIPKDSATLSLYYHAKLPHLSSPDDVPVIPEQFHDLLVLYAVARAKYQDEEESMQQNAMREYLMRKEQFIAFTQTGESYSVQEVYW